MGLLAVDWLRSRVSAVFQHHHHLAPLPAWSKTTGSVSCQGYTYTTEGASLAEKVIDFRQKILKVKNKALLERKVFANFCQSVKIFSRRCNFFLSKIKIKIFLSKTENRFPIEGVPRRNRRFVTQRRRALREHRQVLQRRLQVL